MCLYVYSPTVATQQLGKTVTAAMNTHATIEERLDLSFSMRPVLSKKSRLLVIQRT
jgi:hypothetical protein